MQTPLLLLMVALVCSTVPDVLAGGYGRGKPHRLGLYPREQWYYNHKEAPAANSIPQEFNWCAGVQQGVLEQPMPLHEAPRAEMFKCCWWWRLCSHPVQEVCLHAGPCVLKGAHMSAIKCAVCSCLPHVPPLFTILWCCCMAGHAIAPAGADAHIIVAAAGLAAVAHVTSAPGVTTMEPTCAHPAGISTSPGGYPVKPF